MDVDGAGLHLALILGLAWLAFDLQDPIFGAAFALVITAVRGGAGLAWAATTEAGSLAQALGR